MKEKKMRTDKAKNTAKVLKEIINNPLQTQREISKNTWVWLWSVNRALDELGQIGTNEAIIDFVALDLELQWLATKEMIRRMKENADKVNNQDIVRFNETAFKRSTVLWIQKDDKKEIVIKFEI